MLQAIRDRAQGLIVWTIVGLIIISFALFGLSSYLSGSATIYAARVNGVNISDTDFRNAYQNYQNRLQQALGSNFRPELFNESMMKQNVLEGLIERELLNQFLDSAGFSTAPEDINDFVRSIPDFKDDEGRFSLELYKRWLSLRGLSAAQFEADLSRDIATRLLQNGIRQSDFVTPEELAHFQRLSTQQRNIAYLLISHQEQMKGLQVSPAELESYYNSHKMEFTTPEKVQLDYLELDINALASRYEVDEAQIRAQYEANISSYVTQSEERKVRHILIKVDEAVDDTKARETISGLLTRYKNGESFAELAREYSQDPGSARQGGELGFFSRGLMDPAFENAAFSMEKGTVSEPVRSKFGYHLILLEDIHPAQQTPYTELREQIKRELQLQQAEQAFYADADKLSNLSYEVTDSLEPVADGLGLTIKQSDWITRRGGKGLFANPRVLAAAFSEEVLTEGHNSEPIEISDTHLLVLRVAGHKPAEPQSPAVVKPQIETRMRQQKARDKARSVAEQALARLREGGKPKRVAKDFNAAWNKLGFIKRQAASSDKDAAVIPLEIRQASFRLPHPDAGKPVLELVALRNGDSAVIMFSEIREGKPASEEQAQTVRKQLPEAYGSVAYRGFLQILKDQSEIIINLDKDEDG